MTNNQSDQRSEVCEIESNISSFSYIHRFIFCQQQRFDLADWLRHLLSRCNTCEYFALIINKVQKNYSQCVCSKLFAMIHDFNVESILKSILIKMLVINISLILVIDSKFLYNCLIRLDIIVEKRLMIDVMILRQFYERREITEMIWIHDINNSANSMIKIKSSTALKTMIDINQINLNIIEWVKRATTRETVNQNKRTKQKDEWDEKF